MLNDEDILMYYERLKNHDWFYFYSDDSNVNTRGIIQENELKRIAQKYSLFKQMYEEFYDAKFNGRKIPEFKKYIGGLK
jgi:hypothetical protein